jgi:hypothetical protein
MPPTRKRSADRVNPKDASKAMERFSDLIAARENTARDGRLEVATALAMTSDKVTVDASQEPFSTNPDNLFTLTFNDNRIGITTPDLMRAFLANLKRLIPEIADDLEHVPENPAMQIQLVVRFVRLALLQE